MVVLPGQTEVGVHRNNVRRPAGWGRTIVLRGIGAVFQKRDAAD